MRISSDLDDAGYAQWIILTQVGKKPVVRVDGAMVKECITADEEAGIAVVYARNEDGLVRDPTDATKLLRVTLRGKVVVTLE